MRFGIFPRLLSLELVEVAPKLTFEPTDEYIPTKKNAFNINMQLANTAKHVFVNEVCFLLNNNTERAATRKHLCIKTQAIFTFHKLVFSNLQQIQNK